MKANTDVYQIVTDRIIAELEKGTAPWKHFARNRASTGAARNIVSNKPYRGINTLLLGIAPFSSPYWMTYKQAQELGGNVKKGGEDK